MILDFAKDHLHLSSPLPLAVALAVAAVWLWTRPQSRLARAYVTAVALGFWFVASRSGADLLVRSVSDGSTPIVHRTEARGADTVVVLSGGAMTTTVDGVVLGQLTPDSLLRALEGARVARLIDAKRIVASGGNPRPDRQRVAESRMLRDAIVRAGIDPAGVVEESESKTTREQAERLASMLRGRPFVLVTSVPHMRRSVLTFRAAGLDPVPSPAPLRSEGAPAPAWLLPTSDSLWVSDASAYELAALAYYRVRRWTRPR